MTMRVVPFLSLLICVMVAVSCKSTKTATESGKAAPVLLSFDNGQEVSKAEFERVYAKNNGGPEAVASHSTDTIRDYLDLYINFKRKVFEAEALGLDTTSAFKQEFGTYRKQLAQPYLSAKEVEDRLVREAYDRSQFLVDASHILITVTEDASPEDTLAAFTRVSNLRDSVLNHGKDFGEMAKKYSQDPSAANNAGNLGYFTSFMMVYPFETAAFNTEVGQVSAPVRTRFGYHIVKVNDRLANEGEKRAAHIIVRVGDRYSAKTEEQAEQIINELYGQLEAGTDFSELARQHSDDPSSANRGGDLGSGRLLPQMEEAKRELGKGDYSKPFKTQFGWHILQVTDVKEVASFEEASAEIKQKISRDSRSQLGRDALIARIKRENNFQLNQENFDSFVATLGGAFPQGSWRPDSAYMSLYNRPLFTLNDDYTASLMDMVTFYRQRRLRYPGKSAAQAAAQVLTQFEQQELLDYEEARLPEKNEDFRNLVQEYRDGILLFTLMEQKVWKKAVEDTLGLKGFYDSNPDLFEADQMVDVREYRSSEKSVIDQVAELLQAGNSPEAIDSIINQESSLAVRITAATYEKGKTEIDDKLFAGEVGYQTPVVETESFYRILVSEQQYPAGVKPFTKAKSEAITRYQDYLEQEWLKELEQKYPVNVNEQVFEQLFR